MPVHICKSSYANNCNLIKLLQRFLKCVIVHYVFYILIEYIIWVFQTWTRPSSQYYPVLWYPSLICNSDSSMILHNNTLVFDKILSESFLILCLCSYLYSIFVFQLDSYLGYPYKNFHIIVQVYPYFYARVIYLFLDDSFCWFCLTMFVSCLNTGFIMEYKASLLA